MPHSCLGQSRRKAEWSNGWRRRQYPLSLIDASPRLPRTRRSTMDAHSPVARVPSGHHACMHACMHWSTQTGHSDVPLSRRRTSVGVERRLGVEPLVGGWGIAYAACCTLHGVRRMPRCLLHVVCHRLVPSGADCSVCWSAPVDSLLLPCGHKVLCAACAQVRPKRLVRPTA